MTSDRQKFIARWLTPLAAGVGRSPENLLGNGLSARDFPWAGVRITYEDGSVLEYRYAFGVRDPARPHCVAVFTEHCGYHEFPLCEDDRFESLTEADVRPA